MKRLHCLLLVHGETIEDLRRNIIAAAESVEQSYAIMGERANEFGEDCEFQMVESSTITDAAAESCPNCRCDDPVVATVDVKFTKPIEVSNPRHCYKVEGFK